MTRLGLVAVALTLALPSPTGAQSAGEPPRASAAPAFSGRYKLVLDSSRGCPDVARLGPVSVVMNVTQAAISGGSEVSGQSASPSETPDNGRFVWLRRGDQLHGASGTVTDEFGLRTLEGYRVWMQIMCDGTAATASGGRARASGTAFGAIEIGLASDPTGEPIGFCTLASDLQWSLEPF